MKIQYVLDRLGPNPAYKPPQRKEFLGPNAEEDFADAQAAYDVPVELLVKAGTVHSHPLAWVHCFPDQTGIAFRRNKQTDKVEPFRKSPGIVVAIPADDPCRKMVAKQAALNAASRGIDVQAVLAEIVAGVQQSRDLQATAEAAAEPTTDQTAKPPATATAAVATPK